MIWRLGCKTSIEQVSVGEVSLGLMVLSACPTIPCNLCLEFYILEYIKFFHFFHQLRVFKNIFFCKIMSRPYFTTIPYWVNKVLFLSMTYNAQSSQHAQWVNWTDTWGLGAELYLLNIHGTPGWILKTTGGLGGTAESMWVFNILFASY